MYTDPFVTVPTANSVIRKQKLRTWRSINFQRRLAFQGSVIIIVIVSFLRNRIPHLEKLIRKSYTHTVFPQLIILRSHTES